MGANSITILEDNGQVKAVRAAMPSTIGTVDQPYQQPRTDRKAQPTPGAYPSEIVDGERWARWGYRDNLPSLIREKIYAVPMAAQATWKLVQMMFGNGIGYYRNEDLRNGNKIQRYYSPAIERFLRLNRIETHYLPAQFLDWRFNMNTFSELIFSGDRQVITNIYHKSAEFCRLSVQNKKTRTIDWLYYSPEFTGGRTPNVDKILKIPLYQWQNSRMFLERLPGKKFAWHSMLPTPGVFYYARPVWMGLLKDQGWLDVSAKVPEVVYAMMNNQIRLKYHVLVPESYYEIRYTEWQTYTHEQRNKIIDEHVAEINKTLKETKNLYSSLVSFFREGIQGDEGKVVIEAIDDKIKENSWVPSSNAADAQIVQGLGLHPSQLGLAPEGGKMGAGSGSDQRESFNTGVQLNTIEQQILLEPLNWIATFNAQTNPDWDVTFFIDHTTHTTTNNQEDGLQPSPTTIEVE